MFVNVHLCSNCAVLIFVKDCESFFECGQLLQETSIYSWKSSRTLIPCKRSTGHRLQLNKGGLTSEVSDSKIFFLSASLKAVIWKYAIPMNFFSRPICTFLLVSFCRPIWTFLLVSFSPPIWTSPFVSFSLLIWTFLFAELTLRKSGELSNRPGVLPTQYISERGTFSKFSISHPIYLRAWNIFKNINFPPNVSQSVEHFQNFQFPTQ